MSTERKSWLDRLIRRFWWPSLWRQLAAEKETNRRSCMDWVEDHTHLQTLCREVGCSEHEVDGDSYGVPGIMELADTLRKRIPPNDQAHASPEAERKGIA